MSFLDSLGVYLDSFGIYMPHFISQSLLYFVPGIWATVRVRRNRAGFSLFSWLLLIWLVPLIGPLLALVFVRNRAMEQES